MKRYRCGCRVAAIGEVAVGKGGATSADGGWFTQRNNTDGVHLVSPCAKHMQGVIVRWGTSRIASAIRGDSR